MAVLVEAMSVIVSRNSIEEKYPGGWEAFVESVPNETLCADDEIARIGFMTPNDVNRFIRQLVMNGLVFVKDGRGVDIAVGDQLSGITSPCDWLEFGHINLTPTGSKVAACRKVGSDLMSLSTPIGWKYEGSLSHKYVCVSPEYVDEGMKFLRHENGVDVYLNLLTGEEVYAGRTDK